MRKRKIFLLLLCCAALLAGCAGSRRSCFELLKEFTEKYGDMPSGQRYRADSEEWEEGAMPADMADILFTEDNGENAFSLCTDYAIFLSSSYGGGEIAFLRAESAGDARRLSEMCAARLERARRALPDAEVGEGACVVQNGTLVILLMLPENERARSICQGLL